MITKRDSILGGSCFCEKYMYIISIKLIKYSTFNKRYLTLHPDNKSFKALKNFLDNQSQGLINAHSSHFE